MPKCVMITLPMVVSAQERRIKADVEGWRDCKKRFLKKWPLGFVATSKKEFQEFYSVFGVTANFLVEPSPYSLPYDQRFDATWNALAKDYEDE